MQEIIKIKLAHPGVKLPTYGTDGAGCFDIYPDLDEHEKISLSVSQPTVIIPTGLLFEIPQGKALMIYSRSGQGFKFNTRLANCVGVIDSDYRGELMVKLTMDEDDYMVIGRNTAIAQGMIIDAPKVQFEVVQELSETARGAGGFGSTDK